jgi:hypothetical protein
VAEGWRTLRNEEPYNLYPSTNNITVIVSRRMRWEAHVARTEEMRNANKVLVGTPEGSRPLERHRRR